MTLSHPDLLVPILCLVILMILVVNGLLWAIFRNQVFHDQVNNAMKTIKGARSPWQAEDDDLAELSRQVEAFKEAHPTKDHPS